MILLSFTSYLATVAQSERNPLHSHPKSQPINTRPNELSCINKREECWKRYAISEYQQSFDFSSPYRQSRLPHVLLKPITATQSPFSARFEHVSSCPPTGEPSHDHEQRRAPS